MLEHVVALMAHSDAHRRFTVEQLTRCVFPPLSLGQHAGITEEGKLVGWLSWANMVSLKAELFLDGRIWIEPHEWNEGETLVMMDFIAPFGHARELARKGRELFPNQQGRWIRHVKGRRRVEVFNVK